MGQPGRTPNQSRRRLLRRLGSTPLSATLAACMIIPLPARTPTGPAASPPATQLAPLDAAAGYATASCEFDSHEPYQRRRHRIAGYLTTSAAASLGPDHPPPTWDAVVRDGTSAHCTITGRQTLAEAPNTPNRRYIRIVASRTITRRGHAPTDDEPEYDVIVVRERRSWLVAAATLGG